MLLLCLPQLSPTPNKFQCRLPYLEVSVWCDLLIAQLPLKIELLRVLHWVEMFSSKTHPTCTTLRRMALLAAGAEAQTVDPSIKWFSRCGDGTTIIYQSECHPRDTFLVKGLGCTTPGLSSKQSWLCFAKLTELRKCKFSLTFAASWKLGFCKWRGEHNICQHVIFFVMDESTMTLTWQRLIPFQGYSSGFNPPWCITDINKHTSAPAVETGFSGFRSRPNVVWQVVLMFSLKILGECILKIITTMFFAFKLS